MPVFSAFSVFSPVLPVIDGLPRPSRRACGAVPRAVRRSLVLTSPWQTGPDFPRALAGPEVAGGLPWATVTCTGPSTRGAGLCPRRGSGWGRGPACEAPEAPPTWKGLAGPFTGCWEHPGGCGQAQALKHSVPLSFPSACTHVQCWGAALAYSPAHLAPFPQQGWGWVGRQACSCSPGSVCGYPATGLLSRELRPGAPQGASVSLSPGSQCAGGG